MRDQRSPRNQGVAGLVGREGVRLARTNDGVETLKSPDLSKSVASHCASQIGGAVCILFGLSQVRIYPLEVPSNRDMQGQMGRM